MAKKKSNGSKVTKEQFVVKAIQKLRSEKSNGIHAVYSGFNSAFKAHFGCESRPTTDKMVADGKLEIRPVRGGVMMYLPGEAPNWEARAEQKAKETVSTILG